ncbi:MAG: hypothetical protein K6E57_04855 [Fibrobacter sp.]|uniref:hypothetical protein n=1 Tax=Fibrobacter sp. UWP2 TaxID=1896216 RepID=UPI000911B6B0|nr:hypothetical protein [Fibrobacter sp. UWP2]MBO7383677.1 hypothetical protein [Fibrobacter sp.]MCR5378270.1 hypothetical protein [Fibrobacter sp.]SHI44566.1 hypothetical protein SAMN05720471_10233 [Fibrobacter sp. UWP2]
MKCFKIFLMSLVVALLSGCSHWFLESTSRLQVENATEDCSITAIDVVSEDGSTIVPWVRETILPGERSHVVEADWVGDFKLRIQYTKSTDASGDLYTDVEDFDIEGGSLYLMVEGDKDLLTYRFR